MPWSSVGLWSSSVVVCHLLNVGQELQAHTPHQIALCRLLAENACSDTVELAMSGQIGPSVLGNSIQQARPEKTMPADKEMMGHDKIMASAPAPVLAFWRASSQNTLM